jgi:hypothetical protein
MSIGEDDSHLLAQIQKLHPHSPKVVADVIAVAVVKASHDAGPPRQVPSGTHRPIDASEKTTLGRLGFRLRFKIADGRAARVLSVPCPHSSCGHLCSKSAVEAGLKLSRVTDAPDRFRSVVCYEE